MNISTDLAVFDCFEVIIFYQTYISKIGRYILSENPTNLYFLGLGFLQEKDEREKERQKLAEELDQKEAKIAQLNAQLQGVEDDNAKKLKVDLLKKCNDELKCTICDELFIMVRFIES